MNIDNHKSINLVEMQGMNALHNVSNIYPIYQKGNVKLINADCMEIMAQYPDNYFDLAVVDPEYGINVHNNFGIGNRNDKTKSEKQWDKNKANEAYFIELKRISKEQIIWGANYFNCFNKKGGAIVWVKNQPLPDSSQCEIASYSRLQKVAMYVQTWTNFVNTKKTKHPTEKPVELYKWIFKNYATKDFKVIDTHGGSFNSAIAAYLFGISEFLGVELDKDYFEEGKQNFNIETLQQSLNFDCC
jgi:site-specific DNA-methyltransferase (adenine-specific)